MPFDLKTYLKVKHGRPAMTRWAATLVAVSLANLSYLRIWDLLLHNPHRNYLTSVPYGWIDHLAAIVGVLLLALLLYGLINVIWHHGNRCPRALAMLAVFVILILPLDFVRRAGGASIEVLTGVSSFVIIGLLALGLLSLSILFRQRFWAVAFWALAICSPYVVFNFVHAIVRISAPEQLYPRSDIPRQFERAPAPETRRLLWVIFDEWDQTILFDQRPKELRLPVLDALVKESVVVSAAYAPANATMVSLPALLQGRLLADATATTDSRLRIRLPGRNEWENFQDENSIVTDVLAMPAKATVLGWYHPYDRILPRSPLLEARSYGFPAYEAIRGKGILSTIAAQYSYLALPIYGRMEFRDLYQRMHADALRAIVDSSSKFLLLHYSIPHTPGIYSASEKTIKVTLSSDYGGYISNLALVDRTLGELLGALDRSGLREQTALILTSDHWWRTAPWVGEGRGYPVPVIIQARKGDQGIKQSGPFAATGLRAIARALLLGELDDNQKISEAVAKQVVPAEIRYIKGVADIQPLAIGTKPESPTEWGGAGR
jgi:hypothetical protein